MAGVEPDLELGDESAFQVSQISTNIQLLKLSLLLARVSIGRKLESIARVRNQAQELWFGNVYLNHWTKCPVTLSLSFLTIEI